VEQDECGLQAEHPGALAGTHAFAVLVDKPGQEVRRLAPRFKSAGEGDRIVWDYGHAKPLAAVDL
jgi:hypothetical protein